MAWIFKEFHVVSIDIEICIAIQFACAVHSHLLIIFESKSIIIYFVKIDQNIMVVPQIDAHNYSLDDNN